MPKSGLDVLRNKLEEQGLDEDVIEDLLEIYQEPAQAIVKKETSSETNTLDMKINFEETDWRKKAALAAQKIGQRFDNWEY